MSNQSEIARTTDEYAELRERAENALHRVKVAQDYDVHTYLERDCGIIIRDLLSALTATEQRLREYEGIVERLAKSTQALIDYCDLSHELPIGMREIVDNARDCMPIKTHHNCRCESPDVDGDGICPNCGDDADYGHMDEHSRAAALSAQQSATREGE